MDFQTRLKVLFESHSCLEKELNPTLMADISAFLNASVESEAEQASVKKMICDLFGLLTHPSSKTFNRDILDEAMKFQMDVHVSIYLIFMFIKSLFLFSSSCSSELSIYQPIDQLYKQ